MNRILSIALLLAITFGSVQSVRLANTKADIERTNREHAVALSTALADQAGAYSVAILGERARSSKLEARNIALVSQVKELKDYEDRLAESLRVFLNGLFVDASGAGPDGLVPAAPAGAVGPGTSTIPYAPPGG